MIAHFKQSGYEFLSNFKAVKVRFEGNEYDSVEHAYQASKSMALEWRLFCMNASSPAEVKKAAKAISVRPDWKSVRLSIMRNLLDQKFNQEPYSTWLLNTGEQYIQEGNYWGDTYWGVDLTKTPVVGENKLGEMLMDIRDRLRYDGDLF